MDQHIRVILATVIGAGIVIGTAGVLIYNQFYEERKRLLRQQNEIKRLDQTVSSLREELEALRKLQSSKRSSAHRRTTRSVSSGDKESEYDMYSAVGTDDGSEEFFDLSDGDDEFEDIEAVRLPNTEKYHDDEYDDPVLAQLLSTVDVLLSGPAEDKRNAYVQLKENLDANSDCVALWWRASKACHNMSSIFALDENIESRKEVIEEGIRYGEKAIELDPQCSEAHKWYAILVGSRGEFQSIKEKIEDGFVFKKHVDIAREINPNDPSVYHLLGRFKYEVAMLSWIERKLATTLFAEPPTATLPEALEDCLKAEKLHKSPWKDNRLLLAKCCIAEGNYASAVRWLDKAAEIPVLTPEEESAHKEVVTLLEKYGSYREKS